MPISKHEEKMVDLRVQMQQNQVELRDYLADLDSWESDIKEKEEQLRTGKTAQIEELPPVRNTIQKKKMKKKKKELKDAESNKPRRISGFDFKAWDKFDVDKALEEIDKKEKEDKTSSSEYETDEEWEMERKKHLANVEKDLGNEFLKKGEYDKAIEAYTKGMAFDATNAVLPANRAMALLKQQKFAAAELDCTVSISLDPLYVKAYLRRASARASLGKFDQAMSDYSHVLGLEPSNKQAKSEVERLQKEIKREKEVPVLSTLTEQGKGIVKPVYKQPEERSKAPLKRIHIEEIGIESTGQQYHPDLAYGATAKKVSVQEQENFEKLVSQNAPQQAPHSSSIAVESNLMPTFANERIQPVNVEPRDLRSQDQQDISLPSVETRTEHQEVLTSTIPSNVLKAQKRPSWNAASNPDSHQSPDSGSGNNQRKAPSRIETERNGTSLPSEGISIPQTSFQFQTDFRLLKNKPEAFFEYFQAIPPSHYTKLFGHSLDADMLMAVLKSLAANLSSQDLYEILTQLSMVKRFSMTTMFLSQSDKQVVRSLMEHLSKSGSRPQNDILSLSRKYEL
ncbi:unnamed protein product [Candidula unifasciata]|uniref:RNA polymerase II-associated protein 3 n=1 Tax=Candidula unifasciata TaxID=100452 RepID=A0A8S4A831_9EUPU|nr:unnamed protein product [Candidula unifasciata]